MKTLDSLSHWPLLTLCVFAAAAQPFSQDDQAGERRIHAVFEDVQRGIAEGNVALFSPHFHSQVRMTLRGGETGLYSASQAYYLLQNFLRERRPMSLSFTTYGESDNTPYATGSAAFTYQGARQHAQVYVALTAAGPRWVITHINIY